MLSDDIIAEKELPYDGWDTICRKIAGAQKFILTKEFATAADGLVENLAELDKIVSYCRVPYPITWVEWLHNDRPHWDPEGNYGARPVDRTRHQQSPHRVGLLLEQLDAKAKKWKAHLFWSFTEAPENGPRINGSFGAIAIDTEKLVPGVQPIIACGQFDLSDFGQKWLAGVGVKFPDIQKRLLEYVLEDWGGESRFMIAMLGLLNARNVAEHHSVDNTALNKRRQRHGKRPLFSHILLKLRPSIHTGGTRSEGGSHKDIRLHFVRGHFKHTKNGLFWWSMHTRGKLEHGVVIKDYEVQ